MARTQKRRYVVEVMDQHLQDDSRNDLKKCSMLDDGVSEELLRKLNNVQSILSTLPQMNQPQTQLYPFLPWPRTQKPRICGGGNGSAFAGIGGEKIEDGFKGVLEALGVHPDQASRNLRQMEDKSVQVNSEEEFWSKQWDQIYSEQHLSERPIEVLFVY
ncbi:hypothetical protein NPIL_672991 [Nephila pilipes]|uniref:Uncharacterized protein n=1 Tax=Nephila pilipes TaxID=299642 RepID=A0A8X6MGB3_NEPPI|nr:hypothetical protein NPIL_672991 [Nephila pilipes]